MNNSIDQDAASFEEDSPMSLGRAYIFHRQQMGVSRGEKVGVGENEMGKGGQYMVLDGN